MGERGGCLASTQTSATPTQPPPQGGGALRICSSLVVELAGDEPNSSDETFDDFLAREGLLAACEEDAIKEIIADQIRAAMAEQHLTKTAMAARMKTDRRQLDRLLDPANPSVTLATLRRAAAAVGRTLRVELA